MQFQVYRAAGGDALSDLTHTLNAGLGDIADSGKRVAQIRFPREDFDIHENPLQTEITSTILYNGVEGQKRYPTLDPAMQSMIASITIGQDFTLRKPRDITCTDIAVQSLKSQSFVTLVPEKSAGNSLAGERRRLRQDMDHAAELAGIKPADSWYLDRPPDTTLVWLPIGKDREYHLEWAVTAIKQIAMPMLPLDVRLDPAEIYSAE